MGEALVSGLIRSGGRSADQIMVTSRREERSRELAESYGIDSTLSNADDVSWADVSWADVSWADASYEDAAEGDTSGDANGYELTPEQAAEIMADPETATDLSNLPAEIVPAVNEPPAP